MNPLHDRQPDAVPQTVLHAVQALKSAKSLLA